MTPEAVFRIANTAGPAGWLGLAACPLAPRAAAAVAVVLPLALSLLCSGLGLAFWSGASGSVATLPGVMELFAQPELAPAGWAHFLAFDLLVGLSIARTARARGIRHLLVLPCLGLTLMLGPAGLLSFVLLATAPGKGVRA